MHGNVKQLACRRSYIAILPYFNFVAASYTMLKKLPKFTPFA